MSLQHNTSIVAESIARLPAAFKDKPRIAALLTSWLAEVQAFEDAAIAFYADRVISNGPTGDLLAKLGKLVGQTSLGYDDATFQVLIQARIKTNRSDGRRETLITIAQLLVPNATIKVREYAPASLWLEPLAVPVISPAAIELFLAAATMAGVYLVFVYDTFDLADSLTTGDIYNGFTTDTGVGLDDYVSPGFGGYFAGAFSSTGGP